MRDGFHIWLPSLITYSDSVETNSNHPNLHKDTKYARPLSNSVGSTKGKKSLRMCGFHTDYHAIDDSGKIVDTLSELTPVINSEDVVNPGAGKRSYMWKNCLFGDNGHRMRYWVRFYRPKFAKITTRTTN